MFNFLKKNEGSQKNGKVAKNDVIAPPKNLPDLARDMYEHESLVSSHTDSGSQVKNVVSEDLKNSSRISKSDFKSDFKSVSEPTTDSVPGLDMSLLKQHSAQIPQNVTSYNSTPNFTPNSIQSGAEYAQYDAVVSNESVHPSNSDIANGTLQNTFSSLLLHPKTVSPMNASINSPAVLSSPVSSSTFSSMSPPILSSNNNNNNNMQANISSPQEVSSYNTSNSSSSDALKMIDDSTGFFKELEMYIRNNGTNTNIITDLMDRDLLDHMIFYHSTKSLDMPFYASSSELSHAIKLGLEGLQNLERNWISNKQKIDLLRKLSSNMESDVRLKSEELKRLIKESKKREELHRINDSASNISANIASSGLAFNPLSISKSVPVIASVPTMHDLDSIHAEILGHINDNQEFIEVNKLEDNLEKSTAISSNTAIISNNTMNNIRDIHDTRALLHNPSSSIGGIVGGKQVFSPERLHEGLHIVGDISKGFYLSNGEILQSLPQLVEALENMDEYIYKSYVNDSKNDFSNWILHVFNNKDLANAVRLSKDKRQLLTVLKSYLNM
jgi:hypothetical protein